MLNNICMVGRLTNDVKFYNSKEDSKPLALFTIANNQGKDKALFVDCRCYGKVAEIVNQYAKKGTMLSVVGRLETTTKKDGTEKLIIDVSSIDLISSKKEEE